MIKRNIWEHTDYQCPIVGTCLSTGELRKLAVKMRLELPEALTDYQLHGCFVGLAKRPERPARILQKYLDRKYSRQLKRIAKANGDEELWRLWTEYADAGDIPGAFWAMMRHPEASEAVLGQIYGEVHMLSHLVGASTRAELRRLAESEARVELLTEALARRKVTLREAVGVWKRRTLALEREVSDERAKRVKVERERVSLREIIESRAVTELENQLDTLRGQLGRQGDQLAQAEADSRRKSNIIETCYREEKDLRNALAAREYEVEALELALLDSMSAVAGCDADCQGPACASSCADPSACPCPRLRGKRVLYVGGRSGLKGQYRQLGARFGCELLHHDGGVEQSPQRLQQMLASADAVVCPVDCVSHDACITVKRLCRNPMKPVLFARSSGLSSLAASLAKLEQVC